MVFAKSYCPYCKRTKQTFETILSELEQIGIKHVEELSYKVIELDELPGNDGYMIQNELYEVTGQRTVPNVFIDGVHIGGNSDVQRLLEEEELNEMLVHSLSAMSDL
jgi:glutaredoxin 3